MTASVAEEASEPAGVFRRRVSRVLALAWQVSRIRLSVVLGIALLSAIVPVVTVVAIARVVTAVAHADSTEIGRVLRWAVPVLVCLLIAQQSLPALLRWQVDELARRFMGRVYRTAMAAGLAPGTVHHLEEAAIRDEFSRVESVGGVGPRAGLDGLIGMWVPRLQGLAALVVLATVRWWLAALLFAALLVGFRRYRAIRVAMMMTVYRQTSALRRAEYFRDLLTDPDNAKESRIFGLRPWLLSRFAEEWTASMTQVWAERRSYPALALLNLLPAGVVSVFAYVYLFRAAGAGRLSGAELITAVLTTSMAWVLVSVSENDLNYEQGSRCATSALDLENRLRRGGQAPVEPVAPGAGAPAVSLTGVSYRYPSSSIAAVSDVDLEVRAGRSLAIVGPNGAGKTTLAKLMLGLYEPSAGQIRRTTAGTSVLFQDFLRLPFTARDNILLGDASPDLDLLEESARRAGALAVIQTLPSGWDTVLSRQHVGGMDLSAGQWQRLAMARALYAVARGSRLLILDEPTAHLDVRAEAEFYNSFLSLPGDVAVVVISHRVGTVRRADEIVVMEGGRVRARGDHDSLLAGDNFYAQMYAHQTEYLA